MLERGEGNSDSTPIYRDKFKADEEEKELKKEPRENDNSTASSEEERSKAVIPAGKSHLGCSGAIWLLRHTILSSGFSRFVGENNYSGKEK